MLSPDEIESKEFIVTLRGYDQEEVTRFLTQIATEMRHLLSLLWAALPPEGSAEIPADVYALLDHAREVDAGLARVRDYQKARVLADAKEEARALMVQARQRALDTTIDAIRQAHELIAKAKREAGDLS